MKKQIATVSLALSTLLFFSGCIAAIGNGETQRGTGTLGQQLIDLHKAKDIGAITDEEYTAQRAKLLGNK